MRTFKHEETIELVNYYNPKDFTVVMYCNQSNTFADRYGNIYDFEPSNGYYEDHFVNKNNEVYIITR